MVRQAHHPEQSRRVIPNDQNHKFKTESRNQIPNLHVSVIEISNFEFIWNLVLVICDLSSNYTKI